MSVSDTGREEHLKQSMNLEVDGYRNLFVITLRPIGEAEVSMYITPVKSVTWQGKEWQKYPCTITGDGRNADGENYRPKFSIVNPEGLFSKYVHAGWTDNALITRYQVLGSHLEANVNSFVKRTWRISRPISMTPQTVIFELRSVTDGQQFFLPARQFYPPAFPQVSL